MKRTSEWLADNGPDIAVDLYHTIVGSSFGANPDVNGTANEARYSSSASLAASVRGCALSILDDEGNLVDWYPGGEELYGFTPDEVLGEHLSTLFPDSVVHGDSRRLADAELSRARDERHAGSEGWNIRKDGSRFWAASITIALHDEDGTFRGYARATRDFTERHEQDEALRAAREATPGLPPALPNGGTIYGKAGQPIEVNDTLLELIGYTREESTSGKIPWADLTPPEYRQMVDLSHNEGLHAGANVPFQQEFIRKDGTRVAVLVSTAIMRLSPFEWISIVRPVEAVPEPAEEEPDEDGEPPQKPGEFSEIVGQSTPVRRMEREIELVAPTDTTVLVLGETGTGKELVARAIHHRSSRRNMPFVTLNCAAIPTGLLESELFGYERGAFTGALQQKIGRFEMAHRGTLFLDEVGDIPVDLQPKLLRALQEKSFERLGGKKTITIDVRLVAATNRDLTQMMTDKLFRSDLYYRLRVFPVTTPALRDRPGDIPLLANFFMKKYAARMGKEIDTIPAETMAAMVKWQWPGNVRELENFIERSVILSRGPALRAPIYEIRGETPQVNGKSTLEQVEREHIVRTFRECNGVVTATASSLGLHRTTLNAMMKKLGISRKDLIAS